MSSKEDFSLSCPIPIEEYPNVVLAHGGGGRLMHHLIEKMFFPAFKNPLLAEQHDGAVLNFGKTKLAFSTDSFVVSPLFFPGGDIGKLAINGTVNDVAMCGAQPLFVSASLIIEEGFPMDKLWRIVRSMQDAAALAGVKIVTGDTKVVDKGKGDGIYINTTGVGIIGERIDIRPSRVETGDVIIINGDLGRHGITIMSEREELAIESKIESDTEPLASIIMELLNQGVEIHCLRDLTRGGLASALIEISEASNTNIHIDESALSISEEVEAVCEILGLDPLYVANEGRFVAFIKAGDAQRALEIMQSHNSGKGASIIGNLESKGSSRVTMKIKIGTNRIIDMLSGEQLPRIC